MVVPESITLDPDFEEILREVAADPDSSLLRVPRPKLIRGLFDRGEPVGAHEPGLTQAERHLVLVHRNELAWLLRQACLIKLVEGPRNKLFVSRHLSAHREVRLMSFVALEERLAAERETAGSVPGGDSALDLLTAWVKNSTGDVPSVSRLAAASFRLQHTDEARVMAVSELANGSEQRSALLVLGDVLAGHPSESVRESAWSHVGFAYSKLLDFPKAQRAYQQLCQLNEQIPMGWMGRLLMSLQMGDAGGARTSADGLDIATTSHLDVVTEWTTCLLTRRAFGEWSPTREARSLSYALCDSFGEPSRRLTHALR